MFLTHDSLGILQGCRGRTEAGGDLVADSGLVEDFFCGHRGSARQVMVSARDEHSVLGTRESGRPEDEARRDREVVDLPTGFGKVLDSRWRLHCAPPVVDVNYAYLAILV
jgi:hypothetical protein